MTSGVSGVGCMVGGGSVGVSSSGVAVDFFVGSSVIVADGVAVSVGVGLGSSTRRQADSTRIADKNNTPICLLLNKLRLSILCMNFTRWEIITLKSRLSSRV